MVRHGVTTAVLMASVQLWALPATAQVSLGAKPQQMLYVAISLAAFGIDRTRATGD